MPVQEQELSRVWTSLRRKNAGLPKVRIIVIPGKRGSGCGEQDWSSDNPVILIPAAILTDPQRALEFLLHRAAHILVPGDTGGLSTSSHGHYHQTIWVKQVEALGLTVSGSARNLTTLTDEAIERYATELKILSDASSSQSE